MCLVYNAFTVSHAGGAVEGGIAVEAHTALSAYLEGLSAATFGNKAAFVQQIQHNCKRTWILQLGVRNARTSVTINN
jgi:hypothetical protein